MALVCCPFCSLEFDPDHKRRQVCGAVVASDIALRWNEFATKHGLRCIRAVSEVRRAAIYARSADGLLDKLDETLEMISHCPHLLGMNDRKWVITFDWMFLHPNNWLKVLEGNYDGRQTHNAAGRDDADHTARQAMYEEGTGRVLGAGSGSGS